MTAAPIYIKLAEELVAMSHSLDRLGAALCEDSNLASPYIEALQEIDRICQMQNAIAEALSYSNPETGCRVSKLDNIRALVGLQRAHISAGDVIEFGPKSESRLLGQ